MGCGVRTHHCDGLIGVLDKIKVESCGDVRVVVREEKRTRYVVVWAGDGEALGVKGSSKSFQKRAEFFRQAVAGGALALSRGFMIRRAEGLLLDQSEGAWGPPRSVPQHCSGDAGTCTAGAAQVLWANGGEMEDSRVVESKKGNRGRHYNRVVKTMCRAAMRAKKWTHPESNRGPLLC